MTISGNMLWCFHSGAPYGNGRPQNYFSSGNPKANFQSQSGGPEC